MIEEVETGRLLATEVHPVSSRDVRTLEPGWRFKWLSEVVRAEVFKLVAVEAPETILGLMSLKRVRGFIEITLLESSPANIGSKKKWKGIAGSLLAFSARLSFELGNEGFVKLIAKTELIEHYRNVYGFTQHGNSQIMILGTVGSARLIATFEKGV